MSSSYKQLGSDKEYEHRLAAAKKIGRHLLPGEEVHHIDGEPLNNNPNNLLVFKTKADHRRHHTLPEGGNLEQLADKSWVCYPKVKECKICGKSFSYIRHNKIYCSQECSSIERRKAEHPSQEELAKLLWEIPTSHIAKQYGVSGKAVEKWCKKYGLDKPPRGYWSKRS